jgi:hypothetical protein
MMTAKHMTRMVLKLGHHMSKNRQARTMTLGLNAVHIYDFHLCDFPLFFFSRLLD